MSEDFPSDLKYNKDYSWVKKEKDIAVVGVVGPSAKKVKEFVFIKLPKKGDKIKKGENYVSLEAVKWTGHLSSPVSGEVTEVNSPLFDEPSKINKNPYTEWIMKVKISDDGELKDLMDSKEAEKYYKEVLK